MRASEDVFFFCADRARDPCAPMVFNELESLAGVERTGEQFDGFPILRARRTDGSVGLFVRTKDVVSNDYRTYAPLLFERFSKVRLAVVVNWHEGEKAPDRVLTFHSTGDVPSGIFAPAIPSLSSAYVRAIERERDAGGLQEYETIVEATHWSGVVYGGHPEEIPGYPVPIYDMEVGSSPSSWADNRACATLARVCVRGPEPVTNGSIILYCGGVHFESNVTSAILSGRWHAGHVLPNHWLASGHYGDNTGRSKLNRCLASYGEPASHVVVHKGIGSSLKKACSDFAHASQLDFITHRQLRNEGGSSA